jgi:arabinose-5-phosphate isomerase
MGEMETPELPALRSAQRVIGMAITELTTRLDNLNENFQLAVDTILKCDGRLIVMGVGKSGHIARKLAATFASTGTPASFVHPTEAMHGDLGMITAQDTILALSQSGESDELRALLPILRGKTNAIVALTGGLTSTLAKAATVTVSTAVQTEACPHNLAPTTSTTVALTIGDALAVAVMEARGFSRSDYAAVHPAGSLGRRLILTVHDLMRTGDEIAVLGGDATLGDAIASITRARAGLACVIDSAGRLIGVLTDGDIRRAFLTLGPNAWAGQIEAMMTASPATISGNKLAFDTLVSFERGTTRIGDIPVLDDDGYPIGVLALKDLVTNGIIPHD